MTAGKITPILSLRNVHKSYGPIEVLHGVDLDVHAGEVVALLGENGAGKSTFVKMLYGSLRPDEGVLMWDIFDLWNVEVGVYGNHLLSSDDYAV